ncbi:Homeodomain-like domain-containing protein [Rhodobacter aestuarii]|uniref:Homeodomain-like domain-containing protein n=1 Tax=Rhodobacter aestuarii TaxID=453582 RepID=A0A1N7Q219_9RHOB|nr:helix-turn-helix domain-containing protein [Rhodobacter aestuarii]PTV94037.1 Homeodomain-like domain-containing protein [Rhodobacter aestuarii]SIT16861.1 Homeodomain-like domain-containing protein [Rhodobacter aestuarii]
MTRNFDVPESLVDVAETFGLGVVLTLMQQFGGQEVEFPRNKPSSALVKAFGEERARDLCHFLSGQRLYVPHGRAAKKRLEVQRLAETGRGRREIAAALGISQRHVRRLANRPPDQLPLFPND